MGNSMKGDIKKVLMSERKLLISSSSVRWLKRKVKKRGSAAPLR